MLPQTLTELLKRSTEERVEIAMALWASLTDADRQAELALSPDQAAELDRRLAEHFENPDSAIPWDEVGRLSPQTEVFAQRTRIATEMPAK